MDILCQHSHLYCQSQRKTQIEECNLYLNYLSCTNCVVTSLVRFHFYCRLVNESWTFWSYFNPGNFCDGIESWDQAMESSVEKLASSHLRQHEYTNTFKCGWSTNVKLVLNGMNVCLLSKLSTCALVSESEMWSRIICFFVWLAVTAPFCSTDMDGHKSGKSFDVHQSLANLLFYAISLSACSLTGWMRGVEPVSSPCFTANLICQHQICCTMLKMQYTLHHGEVHP